MGSRCDGLLMDTLHTGPVGASMEQVADFQPDEEERVDAGKSEEEIAAAKRAKSKKKQVGGKHCVPRHRSTVAIVSCTLSIQDKKKTKEQDLINAKSQIQAENAGPSAREVELAKINAKLVSEAVVVKTIISDGNCLYRFALYAIYLSHCLSYSIFSCVC